MMRLLFVLATVLGIAIAAPLHAEAAPVTKAQARSLSERKLKAILMAQLSELVREPVHSTNPSPRRVLDHVTYITRPRATEVPGLCALDMLVLDFRPQADEPWDQNTPVLANGFDAHHYFLVRKPTNKSYDDVADFAHAPDDAACASSDFIKDAWFNAADTESASNGALLARRAVAQAGTGYKLDCKDAGLDLKGDCAPALARLDPATISSIDRCDTDPADHLVRTCYEVYFGDVALRIRASATGDGGESKLSIVSVDFQQLIIFADSKRD